MPHPSAPRLGSVCPHSGIAPWARREGPSMAQRGYPGIHAGMPTAQCLRSASVV
ncbi:nucleoid-structuring protein H-NS [Pseudomonas ogarae]|uniref:nucleoid-structuring protein H-NS n=1 Tax=Pseudomonas ogarae (strain DSM 112162 / CECT 30235 / F113) TaxID=1114970 RepID=UPI00139225B9|nr:nucleoid-structuring protein H-NS [Pseudomonas ogarae]